MLNPRAIATLGIGYGPAMVARIGLWPAGVTPPVEPPAITTGGSGSAGGASRARRRRQREEDEAVLLGLI